MRRLPLHFLQCLASAGLLALVACTPALNWREVRPSGGELKALLPCQPDAATRTQQIGTGAYELHLLGCEAAGGLYALATLPLGSAATPAQARALQQAWEAGWAIRLAAEPVEMKSVTVKGADWSRAVSACGRPAGGEPTCSAAVWFARGTTVYQAALYAPRIAAPQRDAFFDGLGWQ